MNNTDVNILITFWWTHALMGMYLGVEFNFVNHICRDQVLFCSIKLYVPIPIIEKDLFPYRLVLISAIDFF